MGEGAGGATAKAIALILEWTNETRLNGIGMARHGRECLVVKNKSRGGPSSQVLRRARKTKSATIPTGRAVAQRTTVSSHRGYRRRRWCRSAWKGYEHSGLGLVWSGGLARPGPWTSVIADTGSTGCASGLSVRLL